MKVYVNGKLIILRKITRFPSDSRSLFIGAAPSDQYHFYGRIFSVKVVFSHSLNRRSPTWPSATSKQPSSTATSTTR